MRYQVILADPPFSYADKNTNGNRGACCKYETMTLAGIKALRPQIDELAAKDCALFLWVPPPLAVQGVVPDLMRAWGFEPKTKAFTWVKLNKIPCIPHPDAFAIETVNHQLFVGTGHYTRANSEDCWLGVRGCPVVRDHSVRQVIIAPRREHSRKPDETYGRIEQLLGDVPRVELFARQRWPGWAHALSNEADRFTKSRGAVNG